MEKSLYTKPVLCFAVENPTKTQAKVIYDWAMANGAAFGESFGTYPNFRYFGVNKDGYTYWVNYPDQYLNNILTFAEFAELAGVEVVK